MIERNGQDGLQKSDCRCRTFRCQHRLREHTANTETGFQRIGFTSAICNL